MPGILRELGRQAADVLYPPACAFCGRLEGIFCLHCRAEITHPGPLLAPRGIRELRSVGLHEGPLRRAVLRLKFGRRTSMIAPLVELLAEEWRASGWAAEAVVPVPVHWTRKWSRGFNQTELLAEALVREISLPVVAGLRRTRRTPDQVGLSARQRAANLHGAFSANPQALKPGVPLLLLDDVCTTGSTLAECAAVLLAAGSGPLYALTVTHDDRRSS